LKGYALDLYSRKLKLLAELKLRSEEEKLIYP
jgi:hypothetical protein